MTKSDDRLTISAAQPVTIPYDLAANSRAHADAVRRSGARAVVFPELSLTGYHLDADVVSPDDTRLQPLVEACRDTDAIALVGAPVAGDYVAMLAVTGEDVEVVYRKMWLGEEERHRFQPGNDPAVVEVDGWRLGLAICKDTGHPEHARDTAVLGMDVYVAGVLEHVGDAEVTRDRARRITNDHDVWVVIASFAGGTGGGFERAAGRSTIWAPEGSIVAEAEPGAGGLAGATLLRPL